MERYGILASSLAVQYTSFTMMRRNPLLSMSCAASIVIVNTHAPLCDCVYARHRIVLRPDAARYFSTLDALDPDLNKILEESAPAGIRPIRAV